MKCRHKPLIPRKVIGDAGLRVFKVIQLQEYIQQPQHAPARPLKSPLPPPIYNYQTNMSESKLDTFRGLGVSCYIHYHKL
jgi:hypothetical protein